MTQEEALAAVQELAQAPAAAWVGSKVIDDHTLLQRCMRCGGEVKLVMPVSLRAMAADPSVAPPDTDAKVFAWKREFLASHAACTPR